MSDHPAGGNDGYGDAYDQTQAHTAADAYYQDGYYGQNDYHDAYFEGTYEQQGYHDNSYYDQGQGYHDDYYSEQYYDRGVGTSGTRENSSAYARPPRRQGDSEEESETFSDFTMKSDAARNAVDAEFYGRPDDRYNSYADSQSGVHAFRPPSSHVSYGANRSSGASTPVYGLDYSNVLPPGQRSREPYPAWTTEAQVPITKEEIEDIFLELVNKFGFQRDSMRNMYDHLMTQLDSRASRMTPNHALLSLHADYIGGDNANFRRWYFAAHLDLDDAVGFANMNDSKDKKARRKAKKSKKKQQDPENEAEVLEAFEGDNSLEAAEYRWKSRMNRMSQHDRARQVALYLLCWGEANQVRFMPECLAFIFKCADDYYSSAECRNRLEPVDEFSYLNNVITPLYQYCRDQCYEIVDGKYVRRERDHNKVIGYDDMNQLFWYPEGIERIVLEDKSRLVDLAPSERYAKLQEVDWKKVFFKTYREKRSWFHLVVNFNRVWVIHIGSFWFYAAYNSPTIYTKHYEQEKNNPPPKAASWSSVGLGGTGPEPNI
ncbi:1,3-beta-D-glucan synthase [Ascosphaera atra]|nr:1,3-beta-D-glucan synthase [Ascosphaera atra]